MEQAFFLLKNQNERWDEIIREYNERKFDELMAGFHQRYSPNRSLRLTSAQNTSKYHPSQNIHLARKLANRENTTFRDHNLAMGRGEELPLETSMSKEPLGGRFVFPAHAMGLTPSQNVEFIDVPESKRGYPVNLFGFEGTPERYGKNQDPEGIIYGNLEEDSVHRLNKNPFMLRDLQRAASMFLPRSKNAPPSKIGLEGAQRHRARELAQMLMDAEIPGALIDPQTARAYGIESFQDIVPTKIGPDGKVISSITENLNDLTGNIGGGIDPLHGTFQQWERTYGPSGRVAELDETHTSPEQMQLLDDQLTAIPGAIMADPTQFYRSEPMDLAWRLLKVDDEIPDFSDEPVDQCEMCNKYLHDSDYHVLNDHNYCSDCYNQLAEPEEFDYDFQDKLTGEPMDLAMRLLKMPLLPESVKRVSDNRTEAQFQDPKTNQVYPMVAEKDPKFRTMNVGIYPNQPEQNLGVPTALDAMDLTDKDIDDDIKEQLNLGLSNAELTETEDGPYYESDMTWTDPERRRRGYASALYNLVNQLGEQKVRPSGNQSDEGKQLWSKRMLPKGEPMEIAMQLLKERVSPEAKRHKLEYDKKYESSPERVKYREELNRERRRRHIMGQGGPDMSHTSQHTIVPEDPHTNRARHFKDKGTLL